MSGPHDSISLTLLRVSQVTVLLQRTVGSIARLFGVKFDKGRASASVLGLSLSAKRGRRGHGRECSALSLLSLRCLVSGSRLSSKACPDKADLRRAKLDASLTLYADGGKSPICPILALSFSSRRIRSELAMRSLVEFFASLSILSWYAWILACEASFFSFATRLASSRSAARSISRSCSIS